MNFMSSESKPNSRHKASGEHDRETMADEGKLEEGVIESPEQATAAFQDRVESVKAIKPLAGWHLAAVTTVLLVGLFLATIETSITATALVSIGEDFNETTTTTWVVISYLLSYMGFAVIFARISDGIGRKAACIIAWLFFAGFSLGAGLAQSISQLIAFRTLQGVGGSGLFSLCMIVLPQITPVKLWALMSGLVGMTFVCSYVLGPILGGVISHNATWRWIYLFNAPAAVIGIGFILIAWPDQETDRKRKISKSLRQMDIVGAILLLVASVLLVFALQQAGSQTYRWDSATIIATLVVSSLSWVAFIAWIFWLEFGGAKLQTSSIFPLSIALHRPNGPGILTSLIIGFPFFMVLINLPIRFQVVNNDSSVMAGIHMLPFLAGTALGTTIGGMTSSRKNLTSHALIVSNCIALLGCGLLTTTPDSAAITHPQYGYQVILGLGFGTSFPCLTMMMALANDFDAVAAAQGAVGQMRVLGGSIGLAIGTIIINRKLSSRALKYISPAQLDKLRDSLNAMASFDETQREAIRVIYAAAFREQMLVCSYVLALAIVISMATWQRHPRSVEESKMRQQRLAEMQESISNS